MLPTTHYNVEGQRAYNKAPLYKNLWAWWTVKYRTTLENTLIDAAVNETAEMITSAYKLK